MASFVSVPTQVTVNTSGNVLTLTGSSTTWTGTPFSVTGVSGCSITAQNVISNTSATITFTAGTQIGIAILSDGTNTFNLSIAPVNSIIINSDNFKRANSALGGVGGGTTDVLNAWEIASNTARTLAGITGNLFTGRLIWPTQFADGTFRLHFGPGYTPATNAIMLFARAQGTTSTSQCVGLHVFPGNSLAAGTVLFSIPAGSTQAHSILKFASTFICPVEGWIELIVSGATLTGNVYQPDGVTLVGTISYTGLTGTYLSAGYAGVISYNFNNIMSEYDAWESIDITANPPFMPLSTTTVFAVTGQATNFSGTPFTVSGVAGCSIFSQVVTDATHATVTIVSGSTAGNLLLTDTISATTFTIFVTATPQIELTPTTYSGSGTQQVVITGINIALSGTPFVVTGTPTATVVTTTILDAHNAIIGLAVGSYAGILTITDSVSGASATFQVYHAIKGILRIGYIGDSITQGTNGDPVTDMGTYLKAVGYNVTQVNRGIGGTTSSHWGTNFSNELTDAIAAISAGNCNWVQIMLGTNDAKTAINTTPALYLANITVVVKACLAIGAKVVLNQPIWTVPGSAAGTWLQGANTNYQQYYAALASLVDNINVFYGDTLGLDWFELHPEDLADGVHPTSLGNPKLGQMWGTSFLEAIGAAIVPVPAGGSNAALTKAQMRDSIRHNLNKLTSLEEDPVTGTAGNPAITHPWPSNDLINSCLLKALSEVNRRAGFNEIQNVNLPVPIATSTPQTFDIRTIGLTQGLSAGQINEIRSVWWIDSAAGTPRRVYPVARDEMDRDSINYMAWSPSTPRRFSMDGYTLSLYPGSSLGGTLMLIVGNGIVGFVTDTDTIETLPMDYHPVIEYVATRLVALTQSTDVEMDKSAQTFGALAAAGIMDVEKWVLRKNVEEQRSIGGQPQNGSYYGGYSYRR